MSFSRLHTLRVDGLSGGSFSRSGLRSGNRPEQRGRLASIPPSTADGLRIALFSGNYNCVRDGANKALNRLVSFLLERGAAVRVYSPVAEVPAFEPAGDLVALPSISIPGRPEYRFSTGLPKSIRDDVRAFAPTHIHLSCPDIACGRAQGLARALGVPVVASVHTRFETYLSYYRLGFLNPLVRARLRSFYAGCDYVLAPNWPMAQSLEQLGVAGERLRIWGRGVESTLFNAGRRSMEWRRSMGYADEELILLFFGRLVHEKGLNVFEAAVRSLKARGLHFRPLVVGDGPARDWLASRLPNARFTRHLEGEELARAVASADILVNPSITEAFGNVNLEAMASGLAIVSADVPSAATLIIHEETGLLADPADPAAYAEAVEALSRAPWKRQALGSAAAAVSRAFGWPDVLNSVLDVYKEAEVPVRSS